MTKNGSKIFKIESAKVGANFHAQKFRKRITRKLRRVSHWNKEGVKPNHYARSVTKNESKIFKTERISPTANDLKR